MARRILFSTDAELSALLFSASGPTSLVSSTMPDHNVKARTTKTPYAELFPEGEVMKTSLEYVFCGVSYADAINRRLVAEGLPPSFEAKPLPWGDWANDPGLGTSQVVITHKGAFYIRYYVKMSANSKWGVRLWHFDDGTLLTPARKDLFFSDFAAKKEDLETTAARQGLDPDMVVLPRNVKAAGVIGIRVGGETIVRRGYEKQITWARKEWLDDDDSVEKSLYK